jgi:hypothetical protein
LIITDGLTLYVFSQGGPITQANLNSGGLESVVTILCKLLDDADDKIQALVVEGLCKLLLSGIITSPKLITRFVLMWSNPVVERNSMLYHVLGAFLQLYPSLSSMFQVRMFYLINIFTPCLLYL